MNRICGGTQRQSSVLPRQNQSLIVAGLKQIAVYSQTDPSAVPDAEPVTVGLGCET